MSGLVGLVSALPTALLITGSGVASTSSQTFVLGTRREWWFSCKADETFTPLVFLI